MFRRVIILAALVLGCGVSVSAQGFRIGDAQPVSSSLTSTSPITPLQATVAVCVNPANAVPCTNKASTFTSVTLGTPCSAATQVVLAGTTTCVTQTDVRGNWGAWVAAGNYDITFTLSTGQSFGPYTISVGIPPGSNLSLGTVTVCNPNLAAAVIVPTCYASVQAAMNAVNSSGNSNGLVLVPCGTFTGPTTWFSSISVTSTCPFEYYLVSSTSGNTTPPQIGTFFTYSSNLTLSSISNSRIDGITFDFGNNGAGLIVGTSYSNNQWPNVAVVRCGSPTVDCIAWQTTGSVIANSNSFNDIGNLYILTNQTTNNQANCMSFTGSGPVNAGAFTTDNYFNNVVCSGGTRNGLIFRLNTDTNYIKRAFITTLSAVASTGCLVLNDVAPASDQDADGGYIETLTCTGAFPVSIRAGQTTGWKIGLTGGGGVPTNVILGGTPLYRIDWVNPSPSNLDLTVGGGRISAVGISNAGPSASTVNGDFTAAATATSGNYWMGNDGNSRISRQGANVFISDSGTVWNFPGGLGIQTQIPATPNLLIAAGSPVILTHFNTSGDSIVVNGSGAITITVGTGAATSIGAITLPVAATTSWNCWLNNTSRAALVQQTGSTNTTATFTNFGTTFAATNWTNGDVLRGGCVAN